MKRVVTKFFVSITAMTLLLSTIFAPVASAATANFSTEVAVKNGLYALAAYECISNNVLQDTAIGNKISSIIPQVGSSKVFIGQWLGDENGMISCETVITKSLGSGNITEDMLGAGKMFNGVYEKDATGEQKIKCNYGIINSSGNALQSGTYSWPQGYFSDAYGDIQDKRSHGVIEVVFDEDGPIRLEGSTGDIDTNYVLESMRNITIKWGEPAKICTPLVKYTEVYSSAGVNAFNESMTFYSSIEATDDDTPFNETIDWYDGTNEYDAWVGGTVSTNPRYTFTLTPVTSSKLKLTNDAKAKLLSNLATLKTGGATNVTDFLNSNPDAKYIVYGRYLFNGDGNASFACNGISVATDDPNFSNLNVTDYWDVSQPYVAAVNAYKNGSASSKSSFRTKFGGNGISEAGSARSINFPGVVGDCKTLAGEFNGINPSSSTAKSKVASYIKASAVEELPEENASGTTGGGSAGNGTNSSSTSTSSDLAECFNNASSLGWILCPVLKFVGVAADGLWQEIADHWLVTDSEQYKSNDSNGVYVAWGSIRNLANIAFAIMLLIVILSQLTGLGISNYGIKKILPSLIIIIILINISFLICQFLIDISNVVGSSIEGIADFIRSKIPSASGVGVGDVFRGTLASLFTAAGIAGIGAGTYVAVTMSGASVLIPLLISIIGVLISIVFAFIILAVRQAGILVLVVISPLAIICYALPNTKSLFDKWKKMFTSLLFIYPVCAACIYGGQVVSSLMLASNNTGFMFNLVAMLLQIIPIFFIPSLIRGSLALAGNIGNKISQMGHNFGGRATGALQKSEATERLRTTGQFNAAQRNRNFFNRLAQRKGVLGAVGRYGGRRMDSAVARYNKMRLDEHQAALYGRSINNESIQRSLASLDIKDMERRVAEDMDNLIQGNQIDTTDVAAIDSAFQSALAEVDADPTNEAKMIRAKALASLLMGKGDTGQSAMLEAIHARVNSTTGVGSQGSEAMRALGGFITYNDKWMASIKGNDTGGYKFMNDLASSHAIKSNSEYAMAGAEKVTQSTIGSMGDSWYRSIDDAIANGSFGANAGTRDALRTYADMATKALTDPRYAGAIKKERLKTLNDIREAEYNMHKTEWLAVNTGKTVADYEHEFGTFQELKNPGDKLVVPHQRAAVPTGFMEAGDWIGGGNGPTRQQQIAYEEWAKHAAEVDRLNSQSNP